jgi:hypothetical protein
LTRKRARVVWSSRVGETSTFEKKSDGVPWRKKQVSNGVLVSTTKVNNGLVSVVITVYRINIKLRLILKIKTRTEDRKAQGYIQAIRQQL